MSEVIEKFNLGRACKYNAKQCYRLPSAALAAHPGLSKPSNSEDFTWAVRAVQQALGFKDYELDGKLGNQTYMAMLQHFDPVNSDYIVFNGNRVSIAKSDAYDLITFDEPNGLDLHKYGNFSRRANDPTSLCLHWGGLNPQHCFNVFASTARQVSSHFLIGLVDGQPVVYQVLDLQHKAWHGGWVNDDSIGIDVCQSPMRQWLDHYEERPEYTVGAMDNPTSRGPKKLLTLDPTIAAATDAFVYDLLEALGWDFIAPEDHGVYKDISNFTVFGHHHVNERKYDIAPWWDSIFPEDEDESV